MGVKRIVKLALISLVVLFCITTAISMLLPSHMIVSRSIDIHSTRDTVYHLVNNVTRWNKWMDIDTAAVIFSPINTGKGASLKMNNTTVTITSNSPSQICTVWQINNGRKMEGDFHFIQTAGKPYFTLQWVFEQKLKWYPWEKFAAIASEKALAPFMEKSLESLKHYTATPN